MTTNQVQSTVILIYGLPGQRKTTLANELESRLKLRKTQRVSLDEEYISFVAAQYPKLFLADLRSLIAPHYHSILLQREGTDAGRLWADHVSSLIEEKTFEHSFVVAEGYLLVPKWQPRDSSALTAVQIKVADRSLAISVRAHEGNYFIDENPREYSMEEIVEFLIEGIGPEPS